MNYNSLVECNNNININWIYQIQSRTLCNYIPEDFKSYEFRYNYRHKMYQYTQNNTEIIIPDEFHNQIIPSSELIALIDFYIATNGYWWIGYDIYCPPGTHWNLTRIINANLFADDGISNICGITAIGSNKQSIIGIDFPPLTIMGFLPNNVCNLTELESIIFDGHPALIDDIPECISSLYYLQILSFYGTEIAGTIPSQLGNQQPYLWYLEIVENANMYGSIPQSLCNMVQFEIDLFLHNVPLTGTIPSCLFASASITVLTVQIFRTWIEGTIPESFCGDGISYRVYLYFTLMENLLIESTMPECLGNINMDYVGISIIGMNGLYGTLPPNMICAYHLQLLEITQNENLITGSIPDCISSSNFLRFIVLRDSNWKGIFPKLPNSPMVSINLEHNEFEGDVTSIFSQMSDESMGTLREITIHNNKFYDNDISEFLSRIWINAPNVSILSFANNEQIHGTLPDLDMDIMTPSHLYTIISDWYGVPSFIAHNCDLYGSIPNQLRFINLKYLTLHNNRLSGSIPEEFRNYNSTDKKESIVILGNRLFSRKLPKWVVSPFNTAINLYVSGSQQDQSILVVVLAFICVVCCVGLILCRNRLEKICNIEQSDDKYEFIANITEIQKEISNWKILSVVCCMLIFYPFCATYFMHYTADSLFSLSWYDVRDDNLGFIHWILLLFAIIYYILLNDIMLKLCIANKQNKSKSALILHNDKIEKNSNALNTENNPNFHQETDKEQDCDIIEAQKDKDIHEEEQKHNNNLKQISLDDDKSDDDKSVNDSNVSIEIKKHCCVELLKCILWTTLYLFGILMVMFYMICTSLPEQNVFGFNEYTSFLVARSVSIVLAVNNSYIVRFMVDSYRYFFNLFLEEHNAEIKLLLRINNILICPVIFSLFLLNDCGAYWIYFWDYCTQNQLRDTFHIEFFNCYLIREEPIFNKTLKGPCDDYSKIIMLEPDEVCNKNGIYGMNINSCIRSFLFEWIIIIMLKIIISHIIIPFIKLIYDIIVQYYYYKQNKIKKIYIDDRFASLATNLESFFAFSFAAPLIVPLTIISIEFNKLLYKFMIIKLKWKLTLRYDNINESKAFPIYLLWTGVVFAQILTLLFFIYSVNNVVISILFGVSLILMNIFCIFLFCGKQNELNNTNDIDDDTQSLLGMVSMYESMKNQTNDAIK